MRLTTYHPCSAEGQEIRVLNLPGPPWAISTACCGRDLYLSCAVLFYVVQNVSRPYVRVKQSRNRPSCGPEGSRSFRPPDFHDIQHMKVVRSSASRPGRLYPQECPWYSFSIGVAVGRKYVTEKSSDTTRNRSRDRPTSSAAP